MYETYDRRTYTITCNCYDPPFRDEVTVRAPSIDVAWTRAKRKVARRYGAKPEDISLRTATRIK